MSPLRQRVLTTGFLITGLTIAGCSSNDKAKPSQPPSPSPSTTTPPHYSFEQVKAQLLKPSELGAGWKLYRVPEAQAVNDIRSCSLTVIKLPGGPKSILTQFGAPENLTKGASYATYVAVYPDETAAAKGFDTIKKAVTKCSKKHFVASKTLPNKQYTLAHRDSWTLTESSVAEWTRLRGAEKNDYSASLSKLGVFYLMHDYALRGNVIFTSTYWQRLDPEQSSKTIEKRATEVLTKQLEKIG